MEKQFHQYAGYAKIILPAFIIILIFTGSSFSQSAVKPGGDGSTGTPYQISSLENLYWLSLSDSVWDKHFVQTANIDASSTISWDDGDGGDAEGFSPIGNDLIRFTGSYNGQNNSITGLYINRNQEENVGLFGFAYAASITNLDLIKSRIQGKENVGALVGKANGSVLNNNHVQSRYIVSYTDNSGGLVGITDSTIVSYSSAQTDTMAALGVIIGGLIGSAENSSFVTRSFSTLDILYFNIVGGGLVGLLTGNSHVNQSYSMGRISNFNGYAGGLVGVSEQGASISDSYSSLNIEGTSDYVGGLIGYNLAGSVISNSYSIGSVSGSTPTGGFVGFNQGLILGGYFNSETSGQLVGAGSTVGQAFITALSTSEMKMKIRFMEFNFDTVWAMTEFSTLPYLRWTNHRIGGPEISGSEGWRMYGIPTEDATFAAFTDSIWVQGFTGAKSASGNANMFIWDESTQVWLAPDSLNAALDFGQGIITYIFEDDDPQVEGIQGGFPKSTLAEGFVSALPLQFDLGFTNGANSGHDGFNLVTNPTSSILNWDLVGRSNVSPTYYTWDSDNNHYDTYMAGGFGTNGGTAQIYPFVGIWVRSSDTGAQITVDSAAIIDMVAPPAKAKSQPVSMLLHIENEAGLSDEWRAIIHDEESQDLESYNAVKMVPLSQNYLLMGSRSGDERWAMENRLLNNELRFDLFMEAEDTASEVIFSIAESSLPDEWEIQLFDLDSGDTYFLDDQHLSLTINEADSAARWQLIITTDVQTSIEHLGMLPEEFKLSQNYPNPFNPATTINFELPENALVELAVFDLTGRKVATLVEGQQPAGYHQVSINMKDLSSGIYFYRMKAGEHVFTKKMTLIK